MISLFCRLLVAGMIFLLSGAFAQAACHGRDIWSDWRNRYPAAFEGIEERARSMPYGEGKLFRISKNGRADSYILGTYHNYDSRFIPLSPGILGALARTSVTVLELANIGGENPFELLGDDPMGALMHLFAPMGERPLDFLTTREQEALSKAVEGYPVPPSVLLTMRPAFVALTLGSAVCGEFSDPINKPGVDMALGTLTRSAGKEVAGLETFTEQMQSINDVPFDMQRDILRTTLKMLPVMPDMDETVKVLYAEGQIGKVVAWMYANDPEMVAEFGNYPDLYLFKLVEERNLRMRDRALPFLDEGGALIGVGAAHLPGEKGLLKLVEEAGYRIEKVE